MTFVDGKLQTINATSGAVKAALSSGNPFRTSGCPNCNRPLYNERPGGVMYNYAQPLQEDELAQAINELANYVTFD